MISLEVASYCQNCPDFEPMVSKYYAEHDVYMQIIRCEHCLRCQRIYNTMKKGEKERRKQ